MADYAHKYTDQQLEVLEKRFQAVYRQAEREVNDKLMNYLHKFKAKDDAKRKLLEAGKITEEEYKKWRYGQMMTGKHWKEMRDRLAQDYTNANQNAVDAMNHRLPDVFAENTNYSMYDIENGLHVDTSFTMYDRQTVDRLLRDNPELLPQPKVDIPKDLRWNKQKIQSAVEQGILQGESIPKIAKRLQKVTDMNKSAATRNARTAMTGAQNGGRIESYKRAKDLGIDMRQCWLATMDSRVRHSHAVMDGETQEVGKEFSNGCMYPGDPNGPPSETWNCRCTLIAQLKGFEHDVSQGRFSKLDDMSYDEWKEYHRSKIKQNNTKSKKQPTNASGEKIKFADRMETDEKWAQAKQIIEILSGEYQTKLREVNIGQRKAKDIVAGSMDVDGTMYLSSRKPDTVIHEFAHSISMEKLTKWGLYDESEFWKEIHSIQRRYKRDVRSDYRKSISAYANSEKGADEFFAEAFAQGKLRELGYDLPETYGHDFTYAEIILDVVRKYFGKG